MIWCVGTMASTSKIKSRMKTIQSTQKITSAMKLVSLSKLQGYKGRSAQFEVYNDAVVKSSERFIEFVEDTVERPSLYLVFMPDLGLCSAYSNGLLRELNTVLNPEDSVISVGSQNYDKVQPINRLMNSEQFKVSDILDLLVDRLDTHRIVAIIGDYHRGMNLEFEAHVLKTRALEGRDDVIYEPDFESNALMLVRQSLMSFIQNAFLISKVSEHTTRRIAMEKATDSAQDMLDELGRRYNRLRQEAITQEISEIVSGMEEM